MKFIKKIKFKKEYKFILIGLITMFLGFAYSKFQPIDAGQGGWNCGVLQADAQMWMNCNNTSAQSGCRADSSKPQGDPWTDGNVIFNQKWKVPVWVELQCFVQLSYGPGSIKPGNYEITGPNGQDYWRYNENNGVPLIVYITQPGHYITNCYTSNYCKADSDFFDVLPDTADCNQSCSIKPCTTGSTCTNITDNPLFGNYCRSPNNPYSRTCANLSICNEQCNPNAVKGSAGSCKDPANGQNSCIFVQSTGDYRCRSDFNPGSTICPICTSSVPPDSIVRTIPTNNATGVAPDSNGGVPLTWTDSQPNNWGQGCPVTNQIYHLMVQEKCTGAFVDYGNTSIVPNAKLGTSYCWKVIKDNGSKQSNPAVFKFTTLTCTPSAPAVAILSSPADNQQVSIGPGNSVPVGYDATSMAWGKGCPVNNNTVHVMVQPNCTGVWTDKGNVTSILGLTVNTTYCWRVDRNNGSQTASSLIRKFTTVDDHETIAPGSGITTSDVCGNGYSGQIDPSRANPLNISVIFNGATGNTYREVWLAFVPSTGTYADNNDTEIDSLINGKIAGSKSIGVKLDLINNKAYTINGSGVWDSGVGSGDLTNTATTATVLGFGSSTTATVTGTDLKSNFKIQFNDTFPYNIPNNDKYNLYVAVVYKNLLGTIKSSYSDPVNNFVYKKISATSSRTTWGIDTKTPSVTMSGPTFSGGTTFTIGWGATDSNTNVPLSLNSYITTDTAGATLKDNSLGPISMILAPPDPTPSTASSNGKVTSTANLGTHNYTITNPSIQAGFGFSLYAKDAACNSTNSDVTAANQKPWLISYNGDISANGGIPGFSVPNIPNYQMPFTTDNNAGFFSTYSALSGNIDLPIKKQSKLQEYSTKLQNSAALPPQESGFANWYDFILDSVTQNNQTAFVPQPGSLTINKPVSAYLGLSNATSGSSGGTASSPKTIGSVALVQNNSVLTVNGGYAYIGGNSANLVTIDISNKTAPANVSTFGSGVPSYSLSSQGNFVYSVSPSNTKLTVANMTNPNSPLIASGNTVVSTVGAATVQTVGNFAYVMDTYSQSLKIYNISNPTAPVSVSKITTGCNPQNVSIVGNYAYVGNNNGCANDFKIINIANPAAPVEVGSLGAAAVGKNEQYVSISGNRAYAGDPFNQKIYIIDITNKNTPSIIGTISGISGMGRIASNGNNLFVIKSGSVDVYDVSNVASPVVISNMNPGSPVNDLYFDNGYLYLLSSAKLSIIDVGNGAAFGGTGTATGIKKNVKIVGNLIINSGTVCDMQALIFVTGTVTINPDFTLAGDSACVFIATGDITINNGASPKTSQSISSNSLAEYDVVYAQLVTDGKLITTVDNAPGVNNKWDGLYVNGGLISKADPILKRDINSNANYLQPANIFVYDPRYREIFKNDISYNKYSLREVGASN